MFFYFVSKFFCPVAVIKKIITHFENKVTRFWFGEGKKYGSIIPVLDLPKKSYYLFAMWTYGKIEIYFQWNKNKKPFDKGN